MDIEKQNHYLEALFEADQAPRKALEEAENEEEKDKHRHVMMENDEKLLAGFLNYFENYGWPKRSVFSEKACQAAWLVIQHSSIELVEKFLPIIKDHASQGEASKKHVAVMEDRLLLWRDEPQIYGSQMVSGIGKTERYIWPVQDPDKVDALRANMDFTNTLAEQAKDCGAIYDPGLKIPDMRRIL